MTIAPHFGREPFDSWHKKGFDQHIVQTAEKRDGRIADVPTLYEIFDKENTADESRRVADVILRGGDFGRPMLAGPGTPLDRVKILREAYVKSISNPELLAEAKKARMDVEPVTGEQLDALGETSHEPACRSHQQGKKDFGVSAGNRSGEGTRSDDESCSVRGVFVSALRVEGPGPTDPFTRQTN